MSRRPTTKGDPYIKVTYNNSLFNYLLKEPGIGSYMKGSGRNVDFQTDRVFVYRYIKNTEYNDIVSRRVLGPQPFYLPFKRKEKQILPPNWNDKDIETMEDLIKDPEITFIALPLVMLGERTKQTNPTTTTVTTMHTYHYDTFKPSNDGSHSIVLLYNKITKEVEILDQDFPLKQLFFEYNEFIDEHLKFYIRPILETFGLKVRRVVHPMIKENRYGNAKQYLEDEGYPSDFSVIYKAFLANYIYHRTENITKKANELDKLVTPPPVVSGLVMLFIREYLKLCAHNNEPPTLTKWIPKPGSKDIPYDFYKPCPSGKIRNFVTGLCEDEPEQAKDIVLRETYVEDKPFYPKHSWTWVGLIFRKWAAEYKHFGLLIPQHIFSPHPYYFAIRYEYKTRLKSQKTHMTFNLPPPFYEFLEKALNDPEIKLIGLTVGIDYQGRHANPIFIDKTTTPYTVERIEVNAPSIDVTYGRNDATLDEKLKELFETVVPKELHKREVVAGLTQEGVPLKRYEFKYIPALDACPYGLHRTEYREVTSNVSDIGGRCAEWTLFYMELRAANMGIPRDVLYSYAIEKIRKTASAKHFISGYMNHLIKESRKYIPYSTKKRKLSQQEEETAEPRKEKRFLDVHVPSRPKVVSRRLVKSENDIIVPFLNEYIQRKVQSIGGANNSRKKTSVVSQSSKYRQK